ncbi:MAG: hypothetical protein LBD59_11560 [Prevotellaceae bacterium]|jgi:hypothetical protein|nr:hypothetical protein [Prevotellaceae bacterium]
MKYNIGQWAYYAFMTTTQTCRVLLACIVFTGIAATAQAQMTFDAVNDTVKTGPLERVKVDVLLNDHIICDNYSWEILTALNANTQGVATKDGDNIVFTPGQNCRNTTVRIEYRVKCGALERTAQLAVIVSNYNLPVNIIDSYTRCAFDMPTNVQFKSTLKYIADSNSSDMWPLDGFSMPVVGDLNGDGKPEIVALGLHNASAGGSLEAHGRFILIFDGQTGNRILKFDAGASFKLRWEPRHNSPGHLAIADMTRNGKAEIVLTTSVGDVITYKVVCDASNNITNLQEIWKKKFKNSTDITMWGSPTPYISDINSDGYPEVIVYNKIFDGIKGDLVTELETLSQFDFETTAANNNKHFTNGDAFVGRRPGAHASEDSPACMAIADIDGDGILDLIAGSKVYKMKSQYNSSLQHDAPVLDRIITGPRSVEALRGYDQNSYYTCMLNDGFTSVADIDMDGKLDVIVFAPAEAGLNSETRFIIYVWDPMLPTQTEREKPKAATFIYTRGTDGIFSYPFIGDINGRFDSGDGKKKLPEICLTTGALWSKGGYSATATGTWAGSKIVKHPLATFSDNLYDASGTFNKDPNSNRDGHVLAFTYHAEPGKTYNRDNIHEKLKLSWVMEHNDKSDCTGLTMFDFDNNGTMELVYRDEMTLRIISPAGKAGKDLIKLNETDPAIIRLNQTGVRSYTGYEAPVIADVNMDGSADIITTSYDQSPSTSTSKLNDSRGYVYVFEHADGADKWAPCPPVWNQAIYFPLQINEDLTVPRFPQPRTTLYTNVVGDVIFPYNGQWVQHPIVRDGSIYKPVNRLPDAVITDMSVAISGNTTKVTLTIKNTGSVSINSNTPISFYNGGGRGTGGYDISDSRTRIVEVKKVDVDIFPNSTVTKTYTLNTKLDNVLIWARITDSNKSFPPTGYDDCFLDDNAAAASTCVYAYTINYSPSRELCPVGNNAIRLTASTSAQQQATREYIWYHNGIVIPNASGAFYDAHLPGQYRCRIKEDICISYSSTVSLTTGTITANNDYLAIVTGQTSPLTVFSNDVIPSVCTLSPFITVAPKKGSARVSNDTIYYTSNAGFAGVDTITYLPHASLNGSANAVIIAFSTESQTYFACPGATVSLKLPVITDVEYHWFTVASNGSAFAKNKNIVDVQKNQNAIQTVWVEAHYKGSVTTRIPIELLLADDCGNQPSTCATQGTLLFREDFGGNKSTDVDPSQMQLDSRITDYQFTTSTPAAGSNEYMLTKEIKSVANWVNGDDNTFAGNAARGYMMVVRAAGSPKLLYRTAIGNLCAGMNMHFSVRAANPATSGTQPKLRFVLQDTVTGAIFAEYHTGNLPLASASLQWLVYGFNYTLQSSSVRLSIYCEGGDLAVDDIEIRRCIAPVTVTAPQTDEMILCSGTAYDLTGNYSDDGTFGSSLVLRWEKNTTNNPYDTAAWTAVTGSQVINNYPAMSIVHPLNVTAADSGYYRLVASSPSAIDQQYYCRAMSRIVRLNVVERYVPSDIRLYVNPSAGTVDLSSYIDTLTFDYSINWAPAPAFAANTAQTTGTIDVSNWAVPTTAVYTYSVDIVQCGTATAKVYLRTVSDYNKTTTVSICKSLPNSETINLNRILGLQTGNGQWNFNLHDANDVFKNNVSAISTGRHAGAKVFNAAKAFAEASNIAAYYDYNGDTSKKQFVFEYSDGNNISKKVILIVY